MAAAPEAKRARTESDLALIVKRPEEDGQLILSDAPQRTSGLQAPTMLLTGHEASGSFSASPLLRRAAPSFRVARSAIPPFARLGRPATVAAVLEGHKNAVLEVQYNPDGSVLYSASADSTAAVWDLERAERTKRFREHEAVVNSLHAARRGDPLVVTGSDDGTAMVWDVRAKGIVNCFEHEYAVTAVTFTDSAAMVWDRRKEAVVFTLEGHTDTVTGIALSPDGNHLLSNAMDNTVRVWDVRPYAPGSRCLKLFHGAQHNFEKTLLKVSWSPDGQRVSAGSADRFVYVWDNPTQKILYKLPGHKGSVNEVVFHPKEPIIGSCGSDKQVFLGEIR